MKKAAMLASLLTLCAAASARADHHLMRIVQVYGGDVSHPDAQYVVLQMCNGGQNILANHDVHFFDAAGAEIGAGSIFPANVASGATQRKVLLATSSAAAVFGVAPDLRIPANLRVAGGKFCFEAPQIDCFAWGNYVAGDATVGNPFNPSVGLDPGDAAQRDLAIDGGTTTLECSGADMDDTNDSVADFDAAAPSPFNNANAPGVLDVDLAFAHAFENGATTGWSAVTP